LHRDDQTYKSIVAWVTDYANVVGNRYASVDELPADNWLPSQLFVKLISAPETWPEGVPVQLFVHRPVEERGTWSDEPVAFTQGTVTRQRSVTGSLFFFTPEETGGPVAADVAAAKLPGGKYLVKAYVDTDGRLADDPALLLGEEDFRGQAVLEKARWREGLRRAERISGNALTLE